MAIPLMSVSGQVVGTPRWKPSSKGMPVIHLHLRATDRRQGPDGDWHDGDEYEVHAVAFKDLAEHIRDSIHAGDLVIALGRVRTERWKDALGNERAEDRLILADCGPSLKMARRRHEHVVRREAQAQMGENQ